MTYMGPSTMTPGWSLLQVKGAGDFEGHLGFGIGLPDRVGSGSVAYESVAGREQCRRGNAGVRRDLGRPRLAAGWSRTR
jgi:hypothetical protein